MLISIIADGNSGGHFVDWTLHWLSGQTKMYNCKTMQFCDIASDPVTKTNAHGHTCNHATTVYTINKYIQLLKAQNFGTIFMHDLLNNNKSYPENSSITQQGIDLLAEHSTKIITLHNPYMRLYNCKYEQRNDGWYSFNGKKKIYSQKEHIYDYIDTYFADSKQQWTNGFDTVWDLREFLALNFIEHNSIIDTNKVPDISYKMSSVILWKEFDKHLHSLFDFLHLNLETTRLGQWMQVYKKWQTVHVDSLLFCENFDYIIDCIVNGKQLNLSRYNLDLLKEAAIQNCLIYKHNLNLKTWQLNKFKTTQQLHNLLEENIHSR